MKILYGQQITHQQLHQIIANEFSKESQEIQDIYNLMLKPVNLETSPYFPTLTLLNLLYILFPSKYINETDKVDDLVDSFMEEDLREYEGVILGRLSELLKMDFDYIMVDDKYLLYMGTFMDRKFDYLSIKMLNDLTRNVALYVNISKHKESKKEYFLDGVDELHVFDSPISNEEYY